jgi:hypothetical protein
LPSCSLIRKSWVGGDFSQLIGLRCDQGFPEIMRI